jgi:hypothetical protein
MNITLVFNGIGQGAGWGPIFLREPVAFSKIYPKFAFTLSGRQTVSFFLE